MLCLDVVDGVHQQPGVARAGGFQQVEPSGVAVEHAIPELAQRIDLVGIVVQHHRADAAREQQTAHDLPEAAEARDDHRPLGRYRVARPLGARAAREAPVVEHEQQRRGRHRERHRDREERLPFGREYARRARRAEHHEGELAALREQEREEPALAADVDGAADRPERGDLEGEEAQEEQRHRAGAAREQAEVHRHPHRDEEEPQQQPLERLHVAFERVAELRAREQQPREERAQRRRRARRAA